MIVSRNANSYRLNLTAIAGLFLSMVTCVNAHEVDLSGRTDKDLQRDITSKPADIIAFAEVTKGAKVLDFLGGAGYYSEILTRAVGPDGTVVLHNNKFYVDYVGEFMAKKEADGHLKGITKLQSEADDLQIGDGQFDIVFLVLGYHDFFHEDEGWTFDVNLVMPQLYRAIKPGGKLLIVDHNASEGRGSGDTKTLHRIEDAFVKADVEKRGFRLVKQSDILRNENDDHTMSVFDQTLRRNTDRFVMLFEKI